jgi:hypothetical protein
MRFTQVLWLALSWYLSRAWACSGHGPPKQWSQEELDALEEKWGSVVSFMFLVTCDLLDLEKPRMWCCAALEVHISHG